MLPDTVCNSCTEGHCKEQPPSQKRRISIFTLIISQLAPLVSLYITLKNFSVNLKRKMKNIQTLENAFYKI